MPKPPKAQVKAKPQANKPRGPILPPGTRLVDSPNWDPNAPKLELAKKNKGKGKGKDEASPTPPPASPTSVPGLIAAIVLGVGVIAGLGFGVSKLLDTQADEIAAQAKAKAKAEAITNEAGGTNPNTLEAEVEAQLTATELRALYEVHVAATAEAAGLVPLAIEELRKPNTYYNPITHGSPRILAPGKSMREGPLRLEVQVSTLSVDRRNIRNKGQHTLLVVKNEGETPLAYRLLMRKANGGECMSPAIISYDAIIIEAGETFELSVCSGRQTVELIDLRMLEVTALGAVWLRQLPPQTLGLTGMAARAHDPGPNVIPCTKDAAELTRGITEAELAWEDIVDYYSRHDCAEYPWWSSYHRAERVLPTLPAMPPSLLDPKRDAG